ncbi:hypothetical protein [Paracoccus sediminilitoris]|uniref:hypothetical protein n=1 Tax=Paracoccus sediminilitoris TaxID=2202419 RepID=UPI000DB9996A|nr:hypothetical protein [Paracoccus sediminilitoris]
MNAQTIIVATLMTGLGLGSLTPYAPDPLRVASVAAKEAAERPIMGTVPSKGQVQRIRNPGNYGLGNDIAGSIYAIVSGHLVRLDAKTGRIISILRPVPKSRN